VFKAGAVRFALLPHRLVRARVQASATDVARSDLLRSSPHQIRPVNISLILVRAYRWSLSGAYVSNLEGGASLTGGAVVSADL
jgi:hypothetical protein